MITPITDHRERALARLPSQFNGAANLQALISLLGDRYQEIENVLQELFSYRALSTAYGKQLDNIGTILNLSRKLGETDSSYRARLFAETSELEKSGEIESLIEVFNLLLGVTPGTHVGELYPAGIQMTVHTDADPEDPVIDSQVVAAMDIVKAGGIKLYLQIASETDAFLFSDASEADVNGNGPIDALHGFGDFVLGDAGKLARVL